MTDSVNLGSMNLGSVNLGVVAYGADDLRVEDVGMPVVSPHEALVEIAYGGICGSDLHYWQHGAVGDAVIKAPLTLGHEIVGTVIEQAADGSGPAAGTRVGVHPATPGGTRRYPADRPNISSGASYLGSAREFPHTNGAFARLVALPGRMLRPLPDTLPLRAAAVIEPASVAWHAVSRAGEVAGRRVLVIGCGPIGSLVVAVLRRAGAREIVAVDVFDGPMAIASSLGATRTIPAADAEAIAEVDADIAIESSGNPRGLASAIAGLTRGGRIVMVGMPPGGDQPAQLAAIVAHEIELVGSFRFNDEIDDVIAALADGSLDAAAVVTHEFGVQDAVAAFGVAADSANSGKVLLTFGGAAEDAAEAEAAEDAL
jgi:L-idonate 5-dehydrogenase